MRPPTSSQTMDEPGAGAGAGAGLRVSMSLTRCARGPRVSVCACVCVCVCVRPQGHAGLLTACPNMLDNVTLDRRSMLDNVTLDRMPHALFHAPFALLAHDGLKPGGLPMTASSLVGGSRARPGHLKGAVQF